MREDKRKWIAVAFAMIACLAATGQGKIFENRKFRQAEGIFYSGRSYRAVSIPQIDTSASYGDPIWKTWLLDDIQVSEMNNLLDMETQKGQNLSGHFVNPVVDSLRFNHSAAMKVCPQGWRLPTLAEFDSAVRRLDQYRLAYMFGRPIGFKGFSSDTAMGKIFKKTQNIRGGFWWCQDTISSGRAYVVKVGENLFYEVGEADIWDLASVRCIKKEEEEE